ncbi:MAG: oxygen-independent coproporphyrinogen III oxidase [Paracoccaceae bacterium]|nr:oxygen-independent coproporphyrinogen III oxidase [Paracoccaceae bacterium]
MDKRLQEYADKMVPRYTSYPTVPNFTPSVGPAAYAGWLGDLAPDQPVSLYAHVPFCRELCWYCGCNMKLARRDAPVAAYAKSLAAEISLVASHLPARMKVSHLHWGGGTPTSLAPSDLQRAMETIRANFDLTPDAELAIECDPRTLEPEMIDLIGKLGFTRASFGVQEFDPGVQAAINRIQTPIMVRAAVSALRAAGVTGINFDLIYGLPHQTVGMLLDTIDLCAQMRPDRIALFGYAHVPWKAKKQRLIDESALPGAKERMIQARTAAEALVAKGYVAVGLDHFALPEDPLAIAARDGTLRRNFQGYTTDRAETLLGFGVTAIGRTPSGFVQSISETGAWSRAVAAGTLPIIQGHLNSRDDRMRAQVIESLMTRSTVELDALGRAFGASRDWAAEEMADLAQMAEDGLVTIDGTLVAITDAGRPFARVVASVFDAYLSARETRHSIAV